MAALLGAAQRRRAGARGRRDGDGGVAARRQARTPHRSCCGRIGRRHGLGDLGERHALRAGIRLGHQLRGAGRARSPPSSSRTSTPARERCWIAELDGERVGSVFVVRKTDAIAKLRLLIIDPKARGLGLGKRLVEECLRFAKDAGYSSMTLWTQSILTAARGIYAARRIQAGRRGAAPLVRRRSHRRDLGHQASGTRSLNRTALAVLAAAVTGVQVGAAITATRYVAAEISPASLAFLRYAIGVACLVPAIALARACASRAPTSCRSRCSASAQFGVLIALLNYGLKTVPAGRGALIFASFPLLTLIVRGARSATSASRWPKLAGILLTLARRRLRARRQDRRQRGRACRRARDPRERRDRRDLQRALPAVSAALPDAPRQRLRDGGSGRRAARAGRARRSVRRARAAFAPAPGRRSCSSGSRPAAAMCCGCGR